MIMKPVHSPTTPCAAVLPKAQWYLPVKAVMDRVCGLMLLVLLSPIIGVAALLVKMTSPGPAFYLQVRVGKDGRPFRIIKLRSMRQDAEAGTGAVWCKSRDARITPIGHLLRATHIDEFPQLINVVCGDMSLIGPRPERPEFVENFESTIEHYACRHLVRPGITGIAQMRLPPDSDLDSVRDKLEFDLYYVRHLNPWLDFLTLCATAIHFASSVVNACVPPGMWIPTQRRVQEDWTERLNGSQPGEAMPAVIRLETALANRVEATLGDSNGGRMMSAT